jgi:hypothetical protein
MAKTPLTNLIEQLENEIKKVSLGGISYYGLIQAKKMASNLLNDEKHTIKSAFNNGEQNVWDRDRDEHHFEYNGGEDYFNKIYKTNENDQLNENKTN